MQYIMEFSAHRFVTENTNSEFILIQVVFVTNDRPICARNRSLNRSKYEHPSAADIQHWLCLRVSYNKRHTYNSLFMIYVKNQSPGHICSVVCKMQKTWASSRGMWYELRSTSTQDSLCYCFASSLADTIYISIFKKYVCLD